MGLPFTLNQVQLLLDLPVFLLVLLLEIVNKVPQLLDFLLGRVTLGDHDITILTGRVVCPLRYTEALEVLVACRIRMLEEVLRWTIELQ